MKVFVQTDIGKVRSLNEDSYYLPTAGENFCAIADGMGGHNAGEVASAMAVQVYARIMRDAGINNAANIGLAVERANQAIFERAHTSETYSGMGTTFTGLCATGRDVHIAHVGDSRAYLIRNSAVLRLTMDHTLVAEMVLKGLITAREAKTHPKRNYITRALGTAEHVDVDLIQLERRPDDVFFLCTDGLSNHLEERDILEISQRPYSYAEKLNAAVQRALDAGGSDNITAMYVTFEEDAQ